MIRDLLILALGFLIGPAAWFLVAYCCWGAYHLYHWLLRSADRAIATPQDTSHIASDEQVKHNFEQQQMATDWAMRRVLNDPELMGDSPLPRGAILKMLEERP
jgi:hypothetical protein